MTPNPLFECLKSSCSWLFNEKHSSHSCILDKACSSQPAFGGNAMLSVQMKTDWALTDLKNEKEQCSAATNTSSMV